MKALFIATLIAVSATTQAQKTIDLSQLKFTENADALLKQIPNQKTSEKQAVHYEIKSPKSCPVNGVLMEESVTIGAFQGTVVSYKAATNLTANTNRLIKDFIARYKQPTKKITDMGDTRAWYWQTPTLFIRLMTSEVGFHDKRGKQIACTVQVITLKALKAGAEPELTPVYDVFSTYKV